MDPHEALLDWYEWLSDDLKSDVDALVGLNILAFQERHPDENINSLSIISEIEHIFERWLKDDQGRPNVRATRVLIARTLIEFFVIRKRTREQWEKIVEMHQESIKEFTEEGRLDLVAPLQRIIESAPYRQQQWQMVIEDWRELCKSKLSDEAIDEWIFRLKYGA